MLRISSEIRQCYKLIPERFLKRRSFKNIPSDNAFEKSIRRFYDCLKSDEVREDNYIIIERQSKLLEEFNSISNRK